MNAQVGLDHAFVIAMAIGNRHFLFHTTTTQAAPGPVHMHQPSDVDLRP